MNETDVNQFRGFSILESEPSEGNFKDFQTLIQEITKLFASISNDVNAM